MQISKPQARSSSDIELPVLNSHARSLQPAPHELNRTANPTAVVDGIEPPTPAYFPSLNAIPPTPSLDAGLLEYTRMHGHSEIPLSPRHPEDDRASVQASEAHGEALPPYKTDNPPVYSHRRRDLSEPVTWPTIAFRLGFSTFFHQIK